MKLDEAGFKVYGHTETIDKEDSYIKFQLLMRDWLRKGFLRKDLMTLKDDTALSGLKVIMLDPNCKSQQN